MEEGYVPVARRAADTLSGSFGPRLGIELEKRIAAGGEPAAQTYAAAEIIALAAFLLTVARFVYDIDKDRRSERAAEDARAEALKREIRITVQLPAGLSAETRDRVIDAVVEAVSDRG